MGKKPKGVKQDFPTISISRVNVDQEHVRKTKGDISNLKQTISDVGLLQPIIVRKNGDDFVVIDGERRLAALKELQVPELIVGRDVIIDIDETEADSKFKQIIANIQREDINDIELGHAFVALKEQYGYQYKEIAEIIGKTPHYVTAKVGLAKRLAQEVQDLIVCDLESAKCIQNTLLDEEENEVPYVMNMNIIEDIARLPVELQRAAYDTIRAKDMDKKEALEYLRSVKRDSDILKLADDVKGLMENYADTSIENDNVSDIEFEKCLKKIYSNLDDLTLQMKIGNGVEREKVLPIIKSLLEKLNSLYVEILSDDVNIFEKESIY